MIRLLISIALLLLSGCGVGLHIDEYGARIGKEQIDTCIQEDTSVCRIKFIGIGIFW